MQAPSPDRLEVLDDVVIEVDAGLIVSITDASRADLDGTELELGDESVLLPGLVDAHIHAPQWPQLGTGLDLALEDWLFAHTFPLEARFVDQAFAQAVWSDMVSTLLGHGTTTAVYFGPRDRMATTLLAETCVAHGQRAFVGRTAMDHPDGTPEWYRDQSAAASVDASAASVEEIRALGSPLVQPIVTPRFIPACTDAALAGLAEIATEMDVRVQTHCSESDWEHNHVLDRCGRSDTQALEAFGLLARSTVLAHGNFMSDADLTTASGHGAGVAHCPLSNTYFANAVFPARRAIDLGTHIGLGTDVAGGASPGLLPQCAHAVSVSRHLDDGVDATLDGDIRGVVGSRIDIVEAFWMATLGGAELLDLPVGLLEPGRRFDAMAVRPGAIASGLRRWPDVDDDVRWFEKIVRLGSPTDIAHVWVDGVRVAGSDE
ncbi:MAG: amidohydrolase family protein [Actinobacteria bacterium]|nr:amidohydrolase family protein [Actinomycetota bacterium]